MSNQIPVKRFTEKGLEEVRLTMESLRQKSHTQKGSQGTPVTAEDVAMLADLAKRSELTEPIISAGVIDITKQFDDRMAMGTYLASVISGNGTDADKGLWAWISMIYLNQLLTPKNDATFLLASEYRYIPDESRLRYYRHLARMAWSIYQRQGDRARLFLSIPCHRHSDFVEQSQKDNFFSNPNILDLCLNLFYDQEASKLKKGISNKVDKAGSVRRLVSVVSPQLYMNFDLYEMSAETIDDILPNEFSRWKAA